MEHLIEKYLLQEGVRGKWKSYKLPGRATSTNAAFDELKTDYDVYQWYANALHKMLTEASEDTNDIVSMLFVPHVAAYLQVTDDSGYGKADFEHQLKEVQALGKKFAKALDALQKSYYRSAD